nr:MAG TPA: INTRON TRANSFERASE [Crassvirales sp.]
MYSREWYEKNKEKIAAQQKEYYQNNKEKKKLYRKQYYQNNKDKAKLWKHNNNSEEAKNYRKQYYLDNKEKWENYKNNMTDSQKESRLETVRKLKKSYGHFHKSELIALKGNKCSICGLEYNGKNGAIFDFHHINPEEKDFNITSYLRHYSKIPERIYKEVEKCILLCSNCHRLEHSDEY